jgi:hypothetical protein
MAMANKSVMKEINGETYQSKKWNSENKSMSKK